MENCQIGEVYLTADQKVNRDENEKKVANILTAPENGFRILGGSSDSTKIGDSWTLHKTLKSKKENKWGIEY